jgi:hypothetical protein
MGAVEHAVFQNQPGDSVLLKIQATNEPHLEIWGTEYHQKSFKRAFGRPFRVLVTPTSSAS